MPLSFLFDAQQQCLCSWLLRVSLQYGCILASTAVCRIALLAFVALFNHPLLKYPVYIGISRFRRGIKTNKQPTNNQQPTNPGYEQAMSVSSAPMDFESDNWDSESETSDTPNSPPQLPDYESDLPDYESDTDATLQIINNVDEEQEEGEKREEKEEHDNDMGSYVPDPKFTFLFDENRHTRRHTCSICMTSDLRILPANRRQNGVLAYDPTNDSVPCVLPCGHMFGQACIRQWMDRQDSCPICRTPMVHELCGHKVRLRPMWQDAVWLIPRTIPDGGRIAPFCRHCEAAERGSVGNGLMETLGRLYYDARRKWKRTGRERDRLLMMKFRVRMDGDIQRLAVKESVGEW
ncbi:hypothetical protein B0T21DRAFT_192387 [Apiosordaria backusii]|uniref:RING-type domain-containing protein n=1 Tax=Apiosordaria backusii TaxID=314023 RepID=A0AA40BKF1_9PEZI|nr:hypothetical protein B0T21DRAFT_192387 [Apiosordaria backusii]